MKGDFVRGVKLLLPPLIVSLMVIPGVMAAIGAIVEAIVYSRENAPHFNPEYAAYGGFIAAPFLIVRWLWSWPTHINKLQFTYYVIFTAGILTALLESLIAGPDSYHASVDIRSVLEGKKHTFHNIKRPKDVYNWLDDILSTVYDDSAAFNQFSRQLPSRLILNNPVRLTQVRSKKGQCSKSLQNFAAVGTKYCFKPFEQSSNEDTSSYSPMNFPYRAPSYKNYAGNTISTRDFEIVGEFKKYPLAGFWVVLKQDLNLTTVKNLLGALEKYNWIDYQTQMIGLDMTVLLPDFAQLTVLKANYVIERAPSGLFIPAHPEVNFNHLESEDVENVSSSTSSNSTSSASSEHGSEVCGRDQVSKHRDFFTPIYLGVIPGVIYIVFSHVLFLRSNARKYIRFPFVYTEIVFVLTIFISMVFRWQAIYFDHCTFFTLNQTLYPSTDVHQTEFFELQGISLKWFESRRILGLALFLHIFNFLKFVMRTRSLGQLVRTIQIAFKDLASFALSFLVVFLAFALLFYTVFSIESEKFQSIPHCISTLWLGMLGELEMTPSLWRVKSWAIPMIVIFTFLCVFILLTVVIAIISDANAVCRSRTPPKNTEDDHEVTLNALLSLKDKLAERVIGKADAGLGNAGRAHDIKMRSGAVSYSESSSAADLCKNMEDPTSGDVSTTSFSQTSKHGETNADSIIY